MHWNYSSLSSSFIGEAMHYTLIERSRLSLSHRGAEVHEGSLVKEGEGVGWGYGGREVGEALTVTFTTNAFTINAVSYSLQIITNSATTTTITRPFPNPYEKLRITRAILILASNYTI